jgi:hypothetical protein
MTRNHRKHCIKKIWVKGQESIDYSNKHAGIETGGQLFTTNGRMKQQTLQSC